MGVSCGVSPVISYMQKRRSRVDKENIENYSDLLRVRAEKCESKVSFLRSKLDRARKDLDQTLSVYGYVQKDIEKLRRRENR